VADDLAPADAARYIQHTLIEAGTTRERILQHARECVTYGFEGAMVPGSWVGLVSRELAGTGLTVASALDFPIVGSMTSEGKAREAAELARLGATQIDIGVQVGWLKSGMFDEFAEDIAGVVRAAGVPIKVMLELPLLSHAERSVAVELSLQAGASWLKNASSGSIETANPQGITWLVGAAAGRARVKASGSIKSLAQVTSLIGAGADLVGTSAGIEIVTGAATEATGSY
jgi:deoxyribose-phosphate aldolase